MAQILERAKTFFINMTRNGEIEYINEDNIEKMVKKIKSQESGNREKMEKDIQDVKIPLEDELIVKKVKVNEKDAIEQADGKVKGSKGKDIQREN